MFVELFGPLIGLEEEWRAQGATEGEINLTAFDWDHVPIVDFGGHPLPRGPAPVTLRESEEELVQREFLGRTLMLLKKTATHALPMDFPVRTMDDWLRVKPYYEFTADRINWDEVAAARRAREEGALIRAFMPGAFDMPRDLMGEEVACLAYYDQPELVADIMATLADTTRRVLEPICGQLTIDQLSVHEDFAGKSGPLVGPAQIVEHFRPYYRAIWEPLAEKGARIFQLDTDGNITSSCQRCSIAGSPASIRWSPPRAWTWLGCGAGTVESWRCSEASTSMCCAATRPRSAGNSNTRCSRSCARAAACSVWTTRSPTALHSRTTDITSISAARSRPKRLGEDGHVIASTLRTPRVQRTARRSVPFLVK